MRRDAQDEELREAIQNNKPSRRTVASSCLTWLTFSPNSNRRCLNNTKDLFDDTATRSDPTPDTANATPRCSHDHGCQFGGAWKSSDKACWATSNKCIFFSAAAGGITSERHQAANQFLTS